jgi:hypothetical protein
MATDLNSLCDALAATIVTYYKAQGFECQVYGSVPGSAVSPAIIAEPSEGTYHATLGAAGGVDYVLAVHALVALGERQAAQRVLNDMISPYGSRSLKAAIESDRTLGGVVKHAEPQGFEGYGTREFGGADYLMATVLVNCYAV